MDNTIHSTKRIDLRFCLILFLVAFIFRMLLLVNSDHRIIGSDGLTYHKIATNLASGNGYSADQDQPYTPYFFREPGYPVFLSVILRGYELLSKDQLSHIDSFDSNRESTTGYRQDIFWIKVIQCIVSSLSILLFYFILKHWLGCKRAFILSLMVAIYYPYAIASLSLVRETLSSFLLLAINLIYISLKTPMRADTMKYLALGLLSGLLTLTLQLYVVFLPFIIVLSILYLKNFKRVIVMALLSGIAFCLTIAPWISRTYNHYPDIRIVKSLGTSYTHELKDYLDTLYLGFRLDNHKGRDFYQDRMVAEYWQPASEIFTKSFSGYYSHQADSLKGELSAKFLAGSKQKSSYYSSELMMRFRKTFLQPIWTIQGESISASLSGEHRHGMLIGIIFGAILGLAGIIGAIFYAKTTWLLFPVMLFHLVLFWAIGDEGRRMLAFRPFFVTYGLIVCYQIIRLVGSLLKHRHRKGIMQ